MKIITKTVCSLIAFAALSTSALYAQESVSIESLLNEMVDRDSVARFPEQNFRLKQHSSYNGASKTPEDLEGWFMNKDLNRKPEPNTPKSFRGLEVRNINDKRDS